MADAKQIVRRLFEEPWTGNWGVIDELVIYMAPMILGDAAQALFAFSELRSLDEALRPRIVDMRAVGADWRITARL